MGAIRTKAFLASLEILKYRAELKTIKAKELIAYINLVKDASNWSLEKCQELSDMRVSTKLFYLTDNL